MERREAATRVSGVANLGSQGVAGFRDERWAHRHCSKDRDLERAYWFLRSEVWFLDEVTAAKRLIGLYGQLGARWTPQIDDHDARALRWLLAETVSIFTLNTVAVAADALLEDETLFAARMGERLSAGVVPADAMRKIAADVDKFIGGVLVAAKAPDALRVDAMGALHPQPPDWAPQFVDLARRIAATPTAARELPRQVDLLAFERLVRRRHVGPEAATRIALNDRRLVASSVSLPRSCVARLPTSPWWTRRSPRR